MAKCLRQMAQMSGLELRKVFFFSKVFFPPKRDSFFSVSNFSRKAK